MTTTKMTGPRIELHLATCSADRHDCDLPSRFGAKIRATGGDFTEARGARARRYVTIPIASEALIVELVRLYTTQDPRGTCVVGRFGFVGDREPVAYVRVDGTEANALARFIGLVRGGAFSALENQADRAAEVARAERAARPGRLREERDRLVFRLAAVNAELAELGLS